MKPKLLTNSILISLALFTFLPHPAKAQNCVPGILGGTIGGVIGGIILGSVVSIIITVLVIKKSLGFGNIELNSKRDHSLSLSQDVLSNRDSSMPVKYIRKSDKFSESSTIVNSTSLLIEPTDKRASGKPAAYLTPGQPDPLSPPPFRPLSPTVPDTTYVGDVEYDIPCIHPSKNISRSSLAGLHKVPSSSKPLTKSLSVDEMKALRLIKDDTLDLEEQYDCFKGPQAGPPSDDEYYVHVVQDMEEQKETDKGGPPKLTTPTLPILPFMRPPIVGPGSLPQVMLKPVTPKESLSPTSSHSKTKRPPTAPKPKPGAPPPTAKKPCKETSQTLPSRKFTRSSSVHEYMNVGFKLPKGKQ